MALLECLRTSGKRFCTQNSRIDAREFGQFGLLVVVKNSVRHGELAKGILSEFLRVLLSRAAAVLSEGHPGWLSRVCYVEQ